MNCRKLTVEDMTALEALQSAYKREIGEEEPTRADLERLSEAIRRGDILFFGCFAEGALVACCSVSPTFSTFDYRRGGVFEDFYVVPAYRHRGAARKLVECAVCDSGVSSLTVGCADCDLELYRALGFTIPLGNLLAYGNSGE